MVDEAEDTELEVPIADAPDDPDDGIEDDLPIEPIPEDDGTPEDGVASLIGDDASAEEAAPGSAPMP